MEKNSITVFIEDAIAGGWKPTKNEIRYAQGRIEHFEYIGWKQSKWTRLMDIGTALLNPLFWQAVGKTRGWDKELFHPDSWAKLSEGSQKLALKDATKTHWRRFIDHLADGKDIDTSLSLL